MFVFPWAPPRGLRDRTPAPPQALAAVGPSVSSYYLVFLSASGAGAAYAACSFFMVGVASGADGAVFGGAASVGVVFDGAVFDGEDCGGPAFFDGRQRFIAARQTG